MITNCHFEQIICSQFPVTQRTAPPVAFVIEYTKDDLSSVVGDQASTYPQTGSARQRGYHYAIGIEGHVVELIDPDKAVGNIYVAWNPGPTYIPTDPPAINPDPYHVYIVLTGVRRACDGMTTAQYVSLVRTICCIRQRYGMSQVIITTPDQINRDPMAPWLEEYAEWELPSELIVDALQCEENLIVLPRPCDGAGSGGGVSGEAPTPACCVELNLRVLTVEQQMAAITEQFAILVEAVNNTLPLAQAAYEETQSIRQYLNSIDECLKCLCPANTYKGVIEYHLVATTDALVLTPNVNRWVNFPTKISDLTPERVQAGPLWTVDLDGGTHSAEVLIRLASADYCAGCTVWLDIVQCGVRTRLQTNVLTAGIQIVNIAWSGNLTITTPCPDLHFEVGTDSTLGPVGSKLIDYGSVRIVL